MSEVLTGVNGKIIKWARERYNMSCEEAASSIGVDVSKYCNWENGLDFPTYAKLKKISDVFKRPSAIFFFPNPPALPQVKADLRTLPNEVVSMLSKNVIKQIEKAKAYQINLQELYGNDRYSILQKREEFPKNITHLSSYFRALLSISIASQKNISSDKEVFEMYRDKFYMVGIYVFKDSFKDDSVSGLCVNDYHYPIIIINNSMSFSRQNFTLFHELYHLISNTSGADIIRDDYYTYLNKAQTSSERSCDIFANEFLIPSFDFENEIKKCKLNDQRICDLSTLYSVSKEAIMFKLLKMNIISHMEYDSLKETFYGDALRIQSKGTHKSGGNHYYKMLSYLGNNYTKDVFNSFRSGRIDNIRASEMLNSKVDHLHQLENVFYRGTKK
ncbi:MAG: XRE family transcriptional regulator [Oscillospiraceae bacterium]|nr:XRE family transcriptional regulator [Oscillospiraceae bacterium]